MKADAVALESVAVLATRDSKSFEMHVTSLQALVKRNAQELRDLITLREQEVLQEIDERTSARRSCLSTNLATLKGLLVRVNESDNADGTLKSDFDICASAAKVKAELQDLRQEMELQLSQQGAAGYGEHRLSVLQEPITACNRAALSLFEIVEEKSLFIQRSDVSTAVTATQALQQLSADSKIGDFGLRDRHADYCNAMHLLDSIFALAASSKEDQRELGAAGACSLMAKVLSVAATHNNIMMIEKCLRIVHALCRYHDETRNEDFNDLVNIEDLGTAGVCAGEV